jgi:hypothetical protein
MENLTIKSIAYHDLIQEIEYLVEVFIMSAPDDLAITNIDQEANKGFIYQVTARTTPDLPVSILDIVSGFIFIIGTDGFTQIGHLQDNEFIEIEENEFAAGLQANVLEVLLLAGDTGDYTA